MNFKKGDIVIGTEKAYFYPVTKEGWIGKVDAIWPDETMTVIGPDRKGKKNYFCANCNDFELYYDEIEERDVISLL